MSPRSNKIPLSGNLQKEFQHLTAAATYNLIMQQSSITIERQKGLMEALFHGDGETVTSQAEMVANGQPETLFYSLYEKHTIISVNRNDTTGASQKKLKKIFSRERAIDFFVGTEIKPEYIKAHDRNLDSGRIEGWRLHSMALEVAQKYKIAKSFAKDYLVTKGNIEDGNFTLPSGTTVEDVVKYVIDKMYALEESEHGKEHQKRSKVGSIPSKAKKGKKASAADNGQTPLTATTGQTPLTAETGQEPSTAQTVPIPSTEGNVQTLSTAENSMTPSTAKRKRKAMPENYIFSGFFAFLLFGPFRSRPNDRLAYLETDDIGNIYDGNKIPSRRVARQIAQDQATTNGIKRGKREKENLENGLVEVESCRNEVMASFSSIQRLQASIRILEKLLDSAIDEKRGF